MGVLDKFLDAIRLNDDYDDDDEFFDDDIEDIEDEPKQKRRFFKKNDDDLDDYDDLDDPFDKPRTTKKMSEAAAVKQPKSSKQSAKQSSSKITPMRKKTGGSSMEVCVIKPSSMEDTRDIADTLIAHCTVVLNLEGIDVEVAQRIIDFSSGSCYSIGGGLQKISSYIFILTPDNVEVSGDIQEILSGAFDIPSMRTNF
ncbi:cell division protein SepF [Lawsonibacter sp. OA9]|uniref:cell division protein SepF n=1 Tax=Oscillospiraceae TaxID=216572 RepID=UPI001F05C35F|nr:MULTISPECIES: cell division protein SepF [Oscillospiraceae]MCH1978261.1 cell division protein SepF [Lawsonibacter sp. OA9]MCH1983308.1 cell division protein SepF [Ruminococcus sp. OA3]